MNTENLSSLISGLGATLKTAKDVRKVYDKDLALDFNPILSFWSIGENKLSEILAFFLNPNESHGQGALFLNSFFKSFFSDIRMPAYSDLHIQCEYPTPEGRRLDIHLDFDKGSFGIGIENKIWAKDQPRQLADYSNFLERKHNGNYCLLYLTPYSNRLPDESSINKDELNLLRKAGKYYSNDHSSGISNLLEEWIKICQAEKVRIFLKNLHQFIQHQINGETFMGQNELVTEYVLQSNERLESAFAICNSKEIICETLVARLKGRIEQIGKERGLSIAKFNISPWEKDTCFTFVINGENGKDLWLTYQFENKWYNGFFYGIQTDGREQKWLAQQLEKLLGASDDEGATQWWAWWKWHDEKKWDDQTFLKINDGTFMIEIEKQLDDILPKIRLVLKDDPKNFW